MDEKNDEQKTPSEKLFNLGAGVDVVQGNELDDIEIESYNDDVFGTGEMSPQDHIKKLRTQLKECNIERQGYLDGWQRLKADFVNFKRREEESKKDFLKFAREGIITDLLPVLESFNMAFANKAAWEKVDPNWRAGVEHINTQLMQVLTSHGLTEVNPIGEVFDPNEHTAVRNVETTDPLLYHKIAEVLQVGFKLNGKLIKSPNVTIYADKV